MAQRTAQSLLSAQTTGNIGLYYACFRLSRQGWNVMPTSRNARGIDILLYSYDGKRAKTIQVKSLSKRTAVPLGKTTDHLTADFVIVCRYVNRDQPECFILTPAEVKRLAVRQGRDGKVAYWLSPRHYEAEKYRDKWHRVGIGAPKPAVPTAKI